MKATILGAGNIGMALAEGLVQSGTCKKQEVTLTKRNLKSLTELQKKGFKTNQSNIDRLGGLNRRNGNVATLGPFEWMQTIVDL